VAAEVPVEAAVEAELPAEGAPRAVAVAMAMAMAVQGAVVATAGEAMGPWPSAATEDQVELLTVTAAGPHQDARSPRAPSCPGSTKSVRRR
jgi:hypothetical protein